MEEDVDRYTWLDDSWYGTKPVVPKTHWNGTYWAESDVKFRQIFILMAQVPFQIFDAWHLCMER